MRGFHDLLRQKPSSLFMLMGWSSVSVAGLMMQSMDLDLVERILVFWSWIQYPDGYCVCCAPAQLTFPGD
jgi:hypothetical protein